MRRKAPATGFPRSAPAAAFDVEYPDRKGLGAIPRIVARVFEQSK